MLETTVVLTDFFSWAILRNLIRAVVTFNICHTILKDKYNTAVTFFTMVPALLVYTALDFSLYNDIEILQELFGILGYYLVAFLVLLFTTEGKIFSKIAAAMFSGVVFFISSAAPMILLMVFDKATMYWFIGPTVPLPVYLFLCTVMLAFSYLFVFIIKVIQLRVTNGLNYKTKYALLLLYPLTHIVGVSSLMLPYVWMQSNDAFAAKITDAHAMVFLSFHILVLILDFFLFFFVDRFEKTEQENRRKEREILQLQTTTDYTVMLAEEKQEFRKLKHDFSNIIATAMGFLEIQQYDKAQQILSNTNMHLHGLVGFSVCSNETINTVLYIKKQYAEQNGVQMRIEIDERYAVYIDDYDLCRLLHNLLDNCIHAASALESDKEVCVSICIEEHCMTVKTENKFLPHKGKVKAGKSENHGYGLKITNDIAKKYGGSHTAQQQGDAWISKTDLLNRPCFSTSAV